MKKKSKKKMFEYKDNIKVSKTDPESRYYHRDNMENNFLMENGIIARLLN